MQSLKETLADFHSKAQKVLYRVIVEENLLQDQEICRRSAELLCCSEQEAFVCLSHDSSFVQIHDGVWEHKGTLLRQIEDYVMENDRKYRVRRTRAMPELTQVIDPAEFVGQIERYKPYALDPRSFSAAVMESIKTSPNNLIVVNNKIANFREAFVKDIYNVVLRERKPMEPIDIALRLFDSKVGIYKRTLKEMVPVRKGSTKLKPAHRKISSDEVFALLNVIEEILHEVVQSRPSIFVRLPDRRVNAYRNHIGIIRVKLNEERTLSIDMNSEADITAKVTEVVDDNRAFLSKLIKQFGSKIDETEIQSRFFEKIWQSILQYDDVWGHKFHTFLHRTLKNILLDELNKCGKRVETVSLNASINDRNSDELQDILRDRATEIAIDPSVLVCSLDFINMIRSSFDLDRQAVLFSMMDGLKDKEIAAIMNKTVAEIAAIKRGFRRHQTLRKWLQG